MFSPPINNIIWLYGMEQPLHKELSQSISNIRFVSGLDENLLESTDSSFNNMVVIDDLMGEAGKSKLLGDIFTKGCHHKNLSAIYIVQNLFDKGSKHRECSLNSDYMVLFKVPRDKTQIRTLNSQMFPGKTDFLSQALDDACKLQEHGYIVLDLHTDTPDEYRVRTLVLPGEEARVYKPI